MPTSRFSIRARTLSLATMALTLKCLPTSRSTSRNESGAVQSALSTSNAALASLSKSRKLANCFLTPTMLALSCSWVSNWRSALLPLGSPIEPVAPPATTIGLWPNCWKRRSASNGTRLPTCRLSAVGSNPQYSVTAPLARRCASPSRSVQSEISPRHSSSSMMPIKRGLLWPLGH